MLVLLSYYTGEYSHGNQIWCVIIGEYKFFGSIVGSDYYAPRSSRLITMPPVAVG